MVINLIGLPGAGKTTLLESIRKEYGNKVIILEDYALTINSLTTMNVSIKNKMIDHFLNSQYTSDKLLDDKIYITQNNYAIRSIMREIPMDKDQIHTMNQCVNIILAPLYVNHVSNLRLRNRKSDNYVINMLPIYRGKLIEIISDSITEGITIRGTRKYLHEELHKIIGEYIHE